MEYIIIDAYVREKNRQYKNYQFRIILCYLLRLIIESFQRMIRLSRLYIIIQRNVDVISADHLFDTIS